MAITTAHNRLSSVNQTLQALRGDRRMRIASPRTALEQAPHGAAAGTRRRRCRSAGTLAGRITVSRSTLGGDCGAGARSGMQLREAILAGLPRLQREARQHGAINVRMAPRAGGVALWRRIGCPRPALHAALAQARAASPNGSRHLLAGDEHYANFIHRIVRPAREVLHRHGLKGFHELRAAYACERYAQLTGHPAPVFGGALHHNDRALDHAARQQIAVELGHHRIDVVSAYVGGR